MCRRRPPPPSPLPGRRRSAVNLLDHRRHLMLNASIRASPRLLLAPSLHFPPKRLSSTLAAELHRRSDAVEFALVSALKSHSSCLPSGQKIHSFALKSGLLRSNLFVRNALINLYARCGCATAAASLFRSAPLLDTASWNIMVSMHVKSHNIAGARNLFDEMPHRDCVSYTTMIMGLAQNGFPSEALVLFRNMMAAAVAPNEVTLATVISACSHSGAVLTARMVHAVVVKCMLDASVLVATNLVHVYASCFKLTDSEAVFDCMPERNTVTWNAMLNAYAKAGRIDSAVDLFERIPVKDLVSWSTMIDGYMQVNRLEEALFAYCGMLRDAGTRPNEVIIVDLISTCGRLSAVLEGRQLHAVVLVAGLDCYAFVQATLIHFYAACQMIDLAYMQFQWGSQTHVSSWNAMIGGFVRNNMTDAARHLFDEMTERDVVSWSTLIAGYVQSGQPGLALELFREMLCSGVQPNEITLVSVLSAIANSGTLEEGKWIHNYIESNSIPFTDNLAAGLIDMYAKRGSISNSLQVFDNAKEVSSSVSPWNAVICGLAMHGDAIMSLDLFSNLERRKIKPNLITFIGVLSACCHAGLVDAGRSYFESMKVVYNLEPSIKHYGCMVDLLGRAGCLEEAEQLIKSMPMKTDVMIWGSMLAAAKSHGNLEIGERAAESLARLDPSHGADRVLISNIYAAAGRWDYVLRVRRAMQSQRLKKVPGCSGIVDGGSTSGSSTLQQSLHV